MCYAGETTYKTNSSYMTKLAVNVKVNKKYRKIYKQARKDIS